jgi:hypothetical protein
MGCRSAGWMQVLLVGALVARGPGLVAAAEQSLTGT